MGSGNKASADRPSMIGQRVLIEGVPFTIVGVAPRGFKGFGLMAEPDVIVPLTVPDIGAPRNYAQAGLLWMRMAGRLRSGTTLDQARAQVDAVWPAIKSDIIPVTHAGAQRENFLAIRLGVESLATGYEPFLQGFRRPLIALQGLAVLALAIGCLNLASLTLRRVAAAAGQRAIRLGLGATSWQASVTLPTKQVSLPRSLSPVHCRSACGRARPSVECCCQAVRSR